MHYDNHTILKHKIKSTIPDHVLTNPEVPAAEETVYILFFRIIGWTNTHSVSKFEYLVVETEMRNLGPWQTQTTLRSI